MTPARLGASSRPEPQSSAAVPAGARRSATSHQHGRKRAIFVFAALLLLTSGNARAQGTVATDRAALEALYNATDGANWTDNTNWLSNAALSQWHGVTTDGTTGRVTDLYLTDNNLSGEIPAELGDLSSLQNLYLWQNNLSGEIPAELGDLSNLLVLFLEDNNLSGAIPAELGDLTNLQSLYLAQNGLSREIPTELGDLTNLQTLDLRDNNLSGEIPAELGDLSSLQNLFLRDNNLSGEIPAELGDLTNLLELYLRNNNLSGEIPAELGDLTNLLVLDLQNNNLSGEIPAELGDLSSLQNLYLAQNGLSGEIPAELGDLSSLLYLYLWGTDLSGEIPAELGGLTSLLVLDLARNNLSGEIPAELGGLTSLWSLFLWGNKLSGEIPDELGDLTNLFDLDLAQNGLSGEIPAELGDLTNLETLYLNQNGLSGEIPDELGDLTNLLKLDLSQNELSGEIPAELGDLSSLQILYLRGNELSGTTPSWLVNLAELRELSLWSNQLTGTIPPEVAPAQDRAALLVLYRATDGANWTDSTNWRSNEPLSEWHGVSTDGQGRIEELRLSANGLAGMIGAELGVLTRLTGLYLNDNELSGTIPPELENLRPLLQVFDIRNTRLCVTSGSALHTWLATIDDFRGAVCATRPPPRRPPSPPPPRPDAPMNLLAEVGDGQVTLSWEAPEDDGGSAITDYEYRIDGEGEWISIGSTETTYTVTGLVNGTAYSFEVRAVNRNRRSLASDPVEATPRAPVALDFTHFTNGGGIVSDFVFVNVSPHRTQPALYFYDQEGQLMDPALLVDVTDDLVVAEDGSLTVLTAMEPLGELTISTHGRGEVVTGSVKVVSDGSIGGLVRYNVPGAGVAGVATSTPVRDALFLARHQAGGITTAAAIHNLEEEAMGVTCQLMSGGMALEEVEIDLVANGQASWFIEDTFASTDTENFLGSVRCMAPGRGRFTAIAAEMDAARQVFTTLPVMEVNRGQAEAATLDFAHFVNGTWITDLVFVNLEARPSGPPLTPYHQAIPSSRPAIYFYDTEGALVAPESVVDITGDLEVTEDGALTVQTEMEPLGVLTISTHGRGDLVMGSVRVVSEGPIGGMLRFDHPGIGVAGVGASLPVRDALFPVRRQEGGITTAAAIHNLGEEAMEMTCRLMKEGVVLEEAEIPLVANGQEALYIEEMFTHAETSDFVGSVRCMAPGEGMFTGVAVELDAENRIFTTLPVVPVPERMSQE